ncbi:acyltransferase family protein [Actinokineospora spheciospongiae]|uniref:acyltransferase family protein n=1 Tax=Actinokineospora spheciospongiae TaxID=909613 RepID=UPI0004B5F236|nr:acyltransferase [Actinokineospora spheciospongiae]
MGLWVPVLVVLVVLGVVGTVLPYLAGLCALRYLSPALASVLALVEPLVAAALAWLLLGQGLGPAQLVGAAVLLVGAVLVRVADSGWRLAGVRSVVVRRRTFVGWPRAVGVAWRSEGSSPRGPGETGACPWYKVPSRHRGMRSARVRMMSHAEYLALRRFPALDGLRAVAAAMVILVHFGGPSWGWLSGWAGVQLFFVLTGFLITTLALREESRTGRVSLREFYLRRAFRIMPVYFVVLAFVVVLLWLRREPAFALLPDQLPLYLTFNNDLVAPGPLHWVGPVHLYGQSWTLGVEQKFYLVWPLLVFAVPAMRFSRRLGLALAAIALALGMTSTMGGLTVHYEVILAGCVLAIVLHDPRGWAALRWVTHPVAATAAALVFVCAHLALPWGIRQVGEVTAIAIYALPVVALIAAIAPGRGLAAWLLSLRPMVWLGQRSYSLYLVQHIAAIVVLSSVPTLQDGRTRTAVAILFVSLAMAEVLYRWVELPMIDCGRRVIGWLRARSDTTGGAEPETVTVPPVPAFAPEPTGAGQVPAGSRVP